MTSDKNLWLIRVAARLDRLRRVPLSVLAELVSRDGACMWPAATDEPPWSSDDLSDREFANRQCGGCTVRDACLELDLRTAGADTVGVWGGLTDDDRRALHPLWKQRRPS
jgi:WhiB family redox-sensing transcriptional regulator